MATAATLGPQQPFPERRRHQSPKSYREAAEENVDSVLEQENQVPELYSGDGKDTTSRSPVRHKHKKSRSAQVNGQAKEDDNSEIIVERYEDKDGEHLVSIKQALDGQRDRRRRNSVLLSGRRAGAGWEKSHIHFAPLSVPLKRRLQTLVVLGHTLSVACLLTFFFLLCAIPVTWPILLPYVVYVLFSSAGYSGNLSYRSDFIRSMRIWSLFASYFPARLHRSAVLPPTRKYIFGYHPHGIISHGAFAAFATEALGFSQLFPGIKNTLLTLDSNFRVPFYREYALTMGLASVSRESCENILSRGGPNGEGMGRGITIVVGGARESLDAQPQYLRLVLKRRKGFVKLAIRTGADLVPVLAFGENELYDQLQPEQHPLIHKIQLVVKKIMGFTVPLFHARGVFNYDIGMMPYRRPLNIVVGRPIKVTQADKPADDYVDELHDVYVKELERIWEEWKDEFASERTGELQIVE
ncbi:diacylglycerol O-acyltransferase 1 [Lecanora helva]